MCFSFEIYKFISFCLLTILLSILAKTFALMPPHTISFAVGVPNVNTFPFEEVSLKLKDGSDFKLQGKDLEIALQYVPSSG